MEIGDVYQDKFYMRRDKSIFIIKAIMRLDAISFKCKILYSTAPGFDPKVTHVDRVYDDRDLVRVVHIKIDDKNLIVKL